MSTVLTKFDIDIPLMYSHSCILYYAVQCSVNKYNQVQLVVSSKIQSIFLIRSPYFIVLLKSAKQGHS